MMQDNLTIEQLRAIFWAEDAKNNGGLIKSQYNEIKRVLSEKDMVWVKNRLKELKEHAIAHVPYYAKYSINDEFPVVNKSSLMENYNQHKASSNYLEPTHISSTSGSTGTPFSVIQDYKKRNRTLADLQVFGELADYPIRERMLFFRAVNFIRTPEQEKKENIFYRFIATTDSEGLQKSISEIIKIQPKTVLSYSGYLYELAKEIIRLGINHEIFHVSSVLAGAEGLPDAEREVVEKAFGCPVYRRYSDMEMGILGQDSGNGSEYKLNYGSYYFECLKLDSDLPAENGELGRIVITDLFNYAFPMIRYDTGDVGVFDSAKEGFPVFREIYGRKADVIYTIDKKPVNIALFYGMTEEVKGIKQWQIIQTGITTYHLRLIAESSNLDINEPVIILKKIVGEDAEITVELVDEIPVLSSHKRRAVQQMCKEYM